MVSSPSFSISAGADLALLTVVVALTIVAHGADRISAFDEILPSEIDPAR